MKNSILNSLEFILILALVVNIAGVVNNFRLYFKLKSHIEEDSVCEVCFMKKDVLKVMGGNGDHYRVCQECIYRALERYTVTSVEKKDSSYQN